ncbi:hypothetical protein BCR34DRAFT_613402 [Clohesyomyces aquaticus]|uniref:U3 small nucleolar RNA-associated protein 10 n=1 Tax=Clohesyomyces aquaticus TaxID=1231657 RepID=A0A1Y1ZT13_9PLEO|nr:hypothetical protein BCR34DRAFT_613402 [Clohesyomyces aquaticus]
MPASSLQAQLAQIAAKSTHQLDLKAQKAAHGKSLLFEPRIAASQSFDSLYLICHEGFRDLCALDHRFTPFSRTLFSEQSKDEDRTQMTKKDNAELDTVLEAFMTLVGPRLLLKPAEKALEWLVRRFRVHEYNTECLVLTYLPYHSSPQFLALLSVLPTSPAPALRFLFPYITPPTSPPRHAIVYTAVHTPAFFSAMQSYVVKVLQAGHQSAQLLSFWSGITTQAIDSRLDSTSSGRRGVQDQRMEELLLSVLPVLNECLKYSAVPEAVFGSYMIIIVLVTKGTFDDKVLDSLMEAVILSQETETLESCLACLAVIAEERLQPHLPRAVLKRILKIPNLSQRIMPLAEKCRIGRLALGCVLGALQKLGSASDSTENEIVLYNILESRLLDQSQVSTALSTMLRLLSGSTPGSTQHRRLLDLVARLGESSPVSLELQALLTADGAAFEVLGVSLPVATQSNMNGDQNGDDEDMLDVDQEPTQAINHSPLPLPLISQASFLEIQHSKPLEEATAAFEQAAAISKRLDSFLSSDVLGRDQGFKKTLFPSFMIRSWCGPNSDRVRVAALRATTSLIEEFNSAVDLQVLIPYLVYALSDPCLEVRRSASACVVAVAVKNKALQSSKGVKIWGSSDVYGKSSSKLHILSREQSNELFAAVLIPILEECVMDPNFAISSVKTVLQSTKSSKNKGTKGVKSSERTSFFAFIGSHIALTPLIHLQIRLLPLLDSAEKHAAQIRLSTVLPLLRDWCTLNSQDVEKRCKDEHLEPTNVDRSFLKSLSAKEAESVILLSDIIQGKVNDDRLGLQDTAFDHLNTIWSSLHSENRLSMAKCLLDLALQEGSGKGNELRKERSLETLRNVALNTDVLLGFIESIPTTARMAEGPPATKRRRTSRSENARVETRSSQEIATALRRLTLVLELIEGSAPEEHPALFKNLFAILGELQQLKLQSGSNLAYLQSLVLGSLSSIVNDVKKQNSAEHRASVRADLLIDCIRHSSSPQVQNSALLLIGNLASWVPELVLHNLMPIFTFIGSSLVRQDDGYSAHVVDQTISQVVPQLASSLRSKHKDFLTGVADLLLSFTAAFEHIPQPRRLKLFSELARTLGPEDSLYAIIALLVDRYPSGTAGRKLITDLLRQFDPIATLRTFRGYLNLVIDAVGPKRKISNTLFSLNEKTPAQIEEALINLNSSLADLASNEILRAHIIKAFKKQSDTAEPRRIFANVLETIIQLSKKVEDRPKLYESCSRVLATCLNLLPTSDLVKSAELLLGNPDQQVQIAAIKSIEVRTGNVSQNEMASVEAILAFITSLDDIIGESSEMDVKITAVSCTDRIVERFGRKNPSAIAAIAKTVAGPTSLASDDDRLRILSLICLASVVDVVEGDEAISLLPVILPKAFDYLEESMEKRNYGLHNSVFTLLSDIVEHLAFMFSSEYMSKALTLSHRSARAHLSDECEQSRRDFYQTLARSIGAKEIFTALLKTLPHAFANGYKATQEHLELLVSVIEHQDKSKLIKASPALFAMLLKTFDLRQSIILEDEASTSENGAIESLEDLLVEAVISMTLKLNDATFRPFFAQLVDWAEPSTSKNMARCVVRSATFYRFLAAFFDRFKSIVTSYASYIVEPAARLLEYLITDEDEHGLRSIVLEALLKSFLHDQDGFWQAPSHFGTILAPLMKQLTIDEADIITDAVIPAITELAATSSSLDNYREMNAILLKYMRAEEAQTRLATVKCEQGLTKRLGEEWLALLPEMLPFISELREDDDEMVERETQRWISMVEGILGEDLDAMLQ